MSPEGRDAVDLELYSNRFTAMTWEMGELMRRVAISTNVKERLDYSCGLLDPNGRLVVNAPHIPVHLGALGLCVRGVAEALELRPGDVAVTNHPGYGGSHLPDITVVTPVWLGEMEGPLLGYVATRAHHAELGGIRPGSMPPAATCLAEEGVVIPPMLLARGGESRLQDVRRLLLEAPFPTRAVEENLADLQAAVAANRRGAQALRRLANSEGPGVVARFMGLLAAEARHGLERALERLGSGVFIAEECLDDGTRLSVRITARDGSMRFDFTGSGDVHPGNLNATPAVVRSVVLYVLRLLSGGDLPLNEGLLEIVDIEIPPGMLSPVFPEDPFEAPAVVGGNVETSQRLTDLILKALGLVACSQGTMNNTLFGNRTFGYYETVCGGAGASPELEGASAVHTHMTNTAITDVEVLEFGYPVRVERFGIRRGSGGSGRRRGGDGVVRELRFLEPLSLSVLGQHRVEAPYGLEGGAAGATGRVRLVRANGAEEVLDPVDEREVEPGDRLILETPGGGGWGEL
jgi:5-oxoprolinase (ATP-hydrolysing)